MVDLIVIGICLIALVLIGFYAYYAELFDDDELS